MSQETATGTWWRQCYGTVAVAVCLIVPSLGYAQESPGLATVQERSRALIPQLVQWDLQTAAGLEARSIPALKAAYKALRVHSDSTEAHVRSGGAISPCDFSVTFLALVVGFSMNKLDPRNLYEPWMGEQSSQALQNYHGSMAACAQQADSAAIAPRVQAQLIEKL